MAASGLEIYNANPVFGGREGATVPELFTLGGWLAGGRDWHFGAMGFYGASLGLWIGLLLWRRHRRLASPAQPQRGRGWRMCWPWPVPLPWGLTWRSVRPTSPSKPGIWPRPCTPRPRWPPP
ncbi:MULTISPECIES: hypothetical protein [unclassified Cyanobium]|uniref:hypothetical protein n=1 Tax=unclassified Cyanobium TaxID=2627006 RepID=UPI0020CDB658|nr:MULTISPECIES: hypothetical protein [unclassified Cyanobium]